MTIDLPFPYNLLPDRLKPDGVQHGVAFWSGRALTNEEIMEISELLGLEIGTEKEPEEVCPACGGKGYIPQEFNGLYICWSCWCRPTGSSISGGFKNDFQKLSDYKGGYRCPPGKGEVE